MVVIGSGELKTSVFFDLVFVNDRKELPNLCSGDAFLMIRKDPVIVGFLKLRKKNVILRRKSKV